LTAAAIIVAKRSGRAACWLLGWVVAIVVAAQTVTATAPALQPPGANMLPLTAAAASADVVLMARWIKASGDNGGKSFIIVDKRNARVFGFASDGGLRGTAPALLGLARGDVDPPGIGDRPLSAIAPQDRITAAGRYVAVLGNDLGKADILWVNYPSGLSLHRVIRGKPTDERRRRLESPSPDDNRISYGCINVPADFFDRVVKPLFHARSGIVYVLPETKTLQNVFPNATSQ
jgi:hypothetical protein